MQKLTAANITDVATLPDLYAKKKLKPTPVEF